MISSSQPTSSASSIASDSILLTSSVRDLLRYCAGLKTWPERIFESLLSTIEEKVYFFIFFLYNCFLVLAFRFRFDFFSFIHRIPISTCRVYSMLGVYFVTGRIRSLLAKISNVV